MTTLEGTPLTAPPATRLPAFLHTRIGGLPRPFWVLWTGSLINRLGTMVEPFMAFYLVGVRGLSVPATGAVMAMFGAGSVFSQVIGGALADRIGRRPTLTLGTLASAAAMVALGYVSSLPALIAVVFALGLTVDMYRPAAQALVADLVPAADRTRAYGLLFWAVNLGFAAAMVAGGTLAGAGFHWLFWIDALTFVVFGLLVWRAVPETRAARPPGGDPGGFGDVLRDRVMVAFAALALVYHFVYLQAFTTLPLAIKVDGLPPAAYGTAMALNGIVIIVVQPLVGARLGRLDHSRVLAAGTLVVGLGFGLTALAAASALGYAATVLVWTLGEIVVAAVSGAVVAALAPAHLRGRYSGLYGTSWSVGGLLAPAGGTWLLSAGAPALWLTCAGLCAAAACGQLLLAPAVRRRGAPASVPDP
ncbi:MFS transporter [Actinomadura scrupuli]|uniref:MFS transporter n=1 Tax=Actinomadura scrupuli TaxID=559629 RepID=UPI003D997113